MWRFSPNGTSLLLKLANPEVCVMTYLVPYDGSELAKSALVRARLHAIALDEAPSDVRKHVFREEPLEVVAVSIVPDSARYAREKGWIRDDEEFRTRHVVERLHREVTDLDPSASFQFERVDGEATAGTISRRLQRKAGELNATMVFIGSKNAGRIITPLTSVGGGVAAEQDYDVCIVRRRLPPEARRRLKSDFFIPA